MKHILKTWYLLILMLLLSVSAQAQQVLVPGGQIIGLHIKDDTVTVAAFDDSLGKAAREAGLEIGDRLVEIQGQPVSSAEDIQTVLQEFPDKIDLTVERGGKRKTFSLEPQLDPTGPRLGVYLRQGISGIGTITWYDPDTGRFGTLGHGVSARNGLPVMLREGTVYAAEISEIIQGKAGDPGLLRGSSSKEAEIGSIYRNTPQGVFGKIFEDFPGQVLPTASFQEVHTGSAVIRSAISGTDPREYSVEILKIYPQDRQDSRNFLLKVTDPALLSATGGIVQGMSGSPILQDGRIIGAVTHVMVSDPTTGYGIFIGNMLDAAA